MKNNLLYYLKLYYPTEVLKIPKKLGGGYTACIPQLGRNVFIGDGESLEEALEDLEKIKREVFSDYLKKGIPIPEPIIDEEKLSGRLVVRMPISLHAKLSGVAKSNNVSLNQYIVSLLSENYSIERVTKRVSELTKPASVIHLYTQEGRRETESESEVRAITDEPQIMYPKQLFNEDTR